MPQKDAGQRTEPPVSEPKEQGASPPATTAALPPLEPPGTRVRSQGFFGRPKATRLSGGAHGKLVHVGLAHYDGPFCFKAFDDMGTIGRDISAQYS